MKEKIYVAVMIITVLLMGLCTTWLDFELYK